MAFAVSGGLLLYRQQTPSNRRTDRSCLTLLSVRYRSASRSFGSASGSSVLPATRVTTAKDRPHTVERYDLSVALQPLQVFVQTVEGL